MTQRRTLNRRGLIDPHNPATWPALLRLADIVRSADWVGLLPLTSAGFRKAVAEGRIEEPIVFGRRVARWKLEYILELQRRKSGLLAGFAAGEEQNGPVASSLGSGGREI